MTLSIDPCVDVDSREVHRLAELQPHVAAGDTPPAAAVQVTITCEGGDVAMTAWDPASGQRVRRTVPLAAAAPVTRPRLLAVSALELAATVVVEAEARRTAAAASPSPPGVDARETAGEMNGGMFSDWRLVVFGGAERFPSVGVLAGGGVRFGLDGRGIGGLSLDAQATFGRAATGEGPVEVMSFSLSPLGGVHKHLGRYTLRAVTGPRLAVGRMHGDVGRGLTLTAPWVGWQLQLGAGAAIARHLLIELTIDGGYVLTKLRGRIFDDPGQLVGNVIVEGAWVGAFLSFGGRS